MDKITVEHAGLVWEIVEWHGDDAVPGDAFDTKREAIHAARLAFNENPGAKTLEVGSARTFNADMTILRRR